MTILNGSNVESLSLGIKEIVEGNKKALFQDELNDSWLRIEHLIYIIQYVVTSSCLKWLNFLFSLQFLQ